MSRVRTGYFVRGEHVPAHLEYPFDVVVVPWRALGKAEWIEASPSLQEAGHEVHVHIPWCYLNPNISSPQHDVIHALLNERNGAGWLRDKNGDRVGPSYAEWRMIDPRDPQLRRRIARAHVRIIESSGWTPDGFMLDFLWDRVAWFADFGLDPEDVGEFDENYRHGIYSMATGIQFGLKKIGNRAPVYGNGWHRCYVLDGTVLENFPLTKRDKAIHPAYPYRGLDVALWGYYGKDTWGPGTFSEPPQILPAGGELIGYNIPKERVVEAVAFAHAYCPGAVVFDNEGNVFRAIEDLSI